jgi:hypothetical protein
LKSVLVNKSLVNKSGDQLAIGDTVIRVRNKEMGKIKAFFEPTPQSPAGSVGIMWSGRSEIEEVSPADIGAAFVEPPEAGALHR